MHSTCPAAALTEESEFHAKLLLSQLERLAARRELEDLGITPSPADIASWLRAGPRERQSFMLAWAQVQAAEDSPWKARAL